MKERVDAHHAVANQDAPTLVRQKHRIPLKCSHGTESDDGHDQCLSPLSPTFSEASSASASSPVPSSKKYIRKEKIGQGAQGSVYRCIEVATGREVAVKVIMTHELSSAELESIKHEVKTIKRLPQHRNLVQYYKATEKKSKQLSIYMEFVAGGSLSSRLRQHGALPLDTVKLYTRQLCEALQHLHRNGIAHRDIKCANVFLSSSGDEAKLGDFGALKEVGCASLVVGLKGTPHWMAPEVIRAEQQMSEDGWFKADIWSLGCAVIEMLTGHSPWQQYSNPLTAMYQIVSSNNTPTIPADATDEAKSFLQLCLQRKPEERALIGGLLKHPFVASAHSHEKQHLHPQEPSRLQSGRKPHELPNKCGSTSPRSETQRVTSPTRLRNATAAMRIVTRNENQPKDDDSPKLPVQSSNPTVKEVVPLATPTSRPSLRKPSIVPKLKPIDLIRSPSNQEKDSDTTHSTQPRMTESTPLSRGVSEGAIGSTSAHIDSKTSHNTRGIPITPVRLRRISTAPAPSRETEEILGDVPNAHKVKLPPLSARPASSTCGTTVL